MQVPNPPPPGVLSTYITSPIALTDKTPAPGLATGITLLFKSVNLKPALRGPAVAAGELISTVLPGSAPLE